MTLNPDPLTPPHYFEEPALPRSVLTVIREWMRRLLWWVYR